MKLARVLPVVDKDIDVVALTPPKSTSLLSTSAQDDKAHELVNCKPLESIEAAVTTEAHENARRTSGRTHEEVQYVRLEQYDYDEVKGIAVIFRNAIVTGAESLVTDCSVVYRPGGGSNFETGAGWNIYRPLTAESPHFNWTSKVDIDRAVLLASFYAHGYFHYIVECLPRVVMVRDFVLRNPDVKIIHYPPVAADLVLLYQLLGIDPARVVEYDTKTLYRANTLIVPTATATFRANTLAVQQTRDLFRDSIPGQLGIPREDPFERARLFLSSSSPGGLIRADRVRIVVHDRGRGKPRSVEQQKELESAILKRFPNAEVTVYNAARANTREMIVMHYRADVVVGPHGAGLSNALFMRRGSSMLEFNIPDRRTDPSIRCHEITATKLGLRYFYESAVGGKHSGVMQINVDDIVAALVPIVDFHENELNSSVHLTK
uniref:Glycosyltransferase 61 catalytic domain-containing protein n=1 Tax=Erythrolobus madagascarensis TaxID=708628 RepID=A0A7S0XMH7_9RHOD|mmetsp:Transcript_2184/g.4887  ORF Transcript_2184/g.4887 Transcript_2184/m.4887 type:complete len:434 (+) Transcript_2184:1-1302(+)